ncbi:MAG TPA: acyl carrier protein, partial [Pseudonocardiaceae bacterium]|nr:acyl carrier protein [Pseudonocardiaceae bacterium]
QGATPDVSWARRVARLAPPRRRAALLGLVREQVAAVLGYPDPMLVRDDRGLLQIGLDSLTAVELRTRLGEATGLRLPATLVFDYPTAADIAAYLATTLVPGEDTPAGPDLEEQDFQRALATVGFARLKLAGLVRSVLELAGEPGDGQDDAESTGSIDDMDLDNLVRLALRDDDNPERKAS